MVFVLVFYEDIGFAGVQACVIKVDENSVKIAEHYVAKLEIQINLDFVIAD